MGRPSTYTPEIAEEICERLAKGEPLAVICRDEHMPAARTVHDWKASPNLRDFAALIARAREDGFDVIAAECLDIAEDGTNDYKPKERPDGSTYEAFDSEHVQRSKLRIETRLKLLAKWDPKRYGDKVALTGGNEDDAPLKFEAVSNRDRAKAMAALLAKSKAKAG
jgi:hypothetical protein